MILLVQFIGALYGLLGIILGAFGAHILKKKFSAAQLQSFETGVKYQMYHAIVLLIIGYNFGFNNPVETYIGYLFIIGTFLFSFSIYGLCISDAKGSKLRFLGPITPIGGLLLAFGWMLLLYHYVSEIF